METEKHYFYVLQCRDNSFYGGYTNNLERRLMMHNAGKAAKYTRGRTPVKLIYSQVFPTKSEAMKAEYLFKSWHRKKKEAFLEREASGIHVDTEKFYN